MLPRSVEPIQPSPQIKQKLFARVDADLAQSARRQVIQPPTDPWWARFFKPASLAFAAAVVIILAVGVWAFAQFGPGSEQALINRIQSSPQAQVRVLAGQNGQGNARGMLKAIPGETVGVLTVNGLPPLSSDKTYEFWLIRGSQPVPAGLFNVKSDGTATLVVRGPSQIGTFDKLGVSIEQSAGEPQPKGPIVMAEGF
jgi:anti-sigma-K factor RskA